MSFLRLIRCIAFLALGVTAGADELNVFAAASLSDVLQDLARRYEPVTHDKVFFNFGASSNLARQIQEGAPADAFFSADEQKMDTLEKSGALWQETRRSLLGNTLVVIVPTGSELKIQSPVDLSQPGVTRIALAETETVPAGVYAKKYLEKIQQWDALSSRVIATENVRACLAAVETGDADFGIVYKTDALTSHRVKIAYEIKAEDGPKISYSAAVLKGSRHPEAAKKFLQYLESKTAQDAFRQYGFLPLHPEGLKTP